MKIVTKELIGKGGERIDCKTEEMLSSRQRFWLVIAAFWLQVIVIVFVIVEIRRTVRTPITNWVDKTIHTTWPINR